VRRPRLTYANVVATLALFLVLGGGAYAAATLPRHSVGARQLKRGAVTSKAVRNHTLRRRDLAGGVLQAGPRGPAGPRGAAGATGGTGRAGAAGSPGASALMGNSTTPLNGGGAVLAPSGPSAPGSQIFDNNQLSPASPIVARDLAVAVDTPPGGTASWTFKLLADDVSTGVECTITGTDRKCTSGNAAGTIDPTRELVLQVLPGSIDNLPAPTTVQFGWRATTP
jgi:hypothetical protein